MKSSREQHFEKVLTSSLRRLSTIARSYARGDEEKDLLQEILLQIWRSLEQFEERSKLDTWAYRVALNTAIGWRRKDWVRSADSHRPIAGDERAVSAGPRDERVILEEFIAGLGRVERALFLLYLEDLSYRQIAEVSGLSESHVGVKLHRLKKAFIERYLT